MIFPLISPFTSRGVSGTPSGGYDADAQAFFDRVTAASGSTSTLEKNAVNQLVLDLKNYGIWSKRKVIYPYVGSSAASCAQNLASSSFTGIFSTGFSFAASGISGVSAYMRSGFNPNVEGLAYNDNSIGFYSRSTNQNTGEYDCGCGNANGSALFDLCCRRSDNTSIYDSANSPSNRLSVSNSNSGGFFLGKANSSTAKLYRAGAEIGTKAMSVHSIPNYELYSYGFNEQNTTIYYTTRDCAFFWIGLGLTDTEAVNLSTAVQTFQTTLSRQV